MRFLALLLLPTSGRCPEPDCRAAATIVDRFLLDSTHGPVAHVRTRCARGHWFMMPASRWQPPAEAPATAAEIALA
jgi:hypothetical protein